MGNDYTEGELRKRYFDPNTSFSEKMGICSMAGAIHNHAVREALAKGPINPEKECANCGHPYPPSNETKRKVKPRKKKEPN